MNSFSPPAAKALTERDNRATGLSGISYADYSAIARDGIHDRLIREVEAMVLHAMGTGLPVPADLMGSVELALGEPALSVPDAPMSTTDRLALLSRCHADLARLVVPAQPATLLLLLDDQRQHPVLHSFGAVLLVRQMMAVAVVSLLVLLGIALSADVNAENMIKGLLALSGHALLVNETFLVAAACVGAALANLKCLNQYVSVCRYDPHYDSTYWTRLVMGLISGTVLSQIIFGAFVGKIGDPTLQDPSILTTMGQPVLALLGGFSADLVHDLLRHFITIISQAFGIRGSMVAAPGLAAPGVATPGVTVNLPT